MHIFFSLLCKQLTYYKFKQVIVYVYTVYTTIYTLKQIIQYLILFFNKIKVKKFNLNISLYTFKQIT